MNLYNHNANISYPFLGNVELPFSNAVVLDCRIQLESRQSQAPTPAVSITGIIRDGNAFTFGVSVAGDPARTYTSGPVPLNASGYAVFNLEDTTSRLMIVLGPDAYEGGTDVIDDETGYQLRPECVVDVASLELTSLKVGANSYLGDVIVRAGRNVKVSTSSAELIIRFSLNAGQYSCDGLGVSDCGQFLRFINGAGPDDSGSVSIVGGTGVQVINVPAANAIDIRAIPEDECSV